MSAAEEYFFNVTAKQSAEINKLKKELKKTEALKDLLLKYGEYRLRLEELVHSDQPGVKDYSEVRRGIGYYHDEIAAVAVDMAMKARAKV